MSTYRDLLDSMTPEGFLEYLKDATYVAPRRELFEAMVDRLVTLQDADTARANAEDAEACDDPYCPAAFHLNP